MLSIAQESPDRSEILALLQESDAFAASLYPPESRHLVDAASLAKPEVRFFVARLDGKAVGCGALVLGKEGRAELKRMLVTQSSRGTGVGRAILDVIEETARREDVRVIRLEAGTQSTAALTLYRRYGYRERGPFGSYQADAFTIFMQKRLRAD